MNPATLAAAVTGLVVAVVVLFGLAAGSTPTYQPTPTCGTTDHVDPMLLDALAAAISASGTIDDPAGYLSSHGLHQPAIQLTNAATITTIGTQLNIAPRGHIIAIATAMQETRLRNLANPTVPESLNHPNEGIASDHDSIGLFQQRPSTGWGTIAQLMDTTYATTTFYTRLQDLPGWEQMALTDAAQAIQRSAYPDAYARWEPLATAIHTTLTHANNPCPPTSGNVLIVGPYALPVPTSTITDPAQLTAPHHDYPAWDLGLPPGTPIYAPTTGTITALTTTGACGWGIILQDPHGNQWNLCHGTPNTHHVTTGQTVTPGTHLFNSGNTGNSTAPHIHLGIRTPTGTRLCPQPWLYALWNHQPIPIKHMPTTGCTF